MSNNGGLIIMPDQTGVIPRKVSTRVNGNHVIYTLNFSDLSGNVQSR